MKFIRKFAIIILTLILLTMAVLFYRSKIDTRIVRAFGPLRVVFQSFPLFNEANWYPGKSKEATISVENTDIFGRTIGVKAVDINETGNPQLSNGLSIQILQNNEILYGEGSATGRKTLNDFYNENVVWLSQIGKGNVKDYNFVIRMDEESGNEYQNKSTEFDLLVGIDIDEGPFKNFRPFPTFKPLPTLPPLPPLDRSVFNFIK